ncbi:uncharacterized protein BDZ99DRAFT_379793 [Mytilinidion resinicola]|uniref:Uncharacterized protein n=1 Tax=Mytilinidion resinicola TaxID=574789 RepID=A0A6A6YZQ6_9PEZI|nr:uncharacterized protein BDZ99DRAFT_379793 [Mytilinidion resinicola]KAF2814402.1 hypothetical protein BDZ99DRAFT_379793 [Mytilinidion resinicola]
MANPAENAPQTSTGMDEAECVAALAYLEKLQDQLQDLRLTMPRILGPLRTPHPSPAALYQDFRHASMSSVNDLKKFRSTWQSPETQTLFEKAKESQKANPDLKANNDVPRYGWTEEYESAVKKTAKSDDGAWPEESEMEYPSILAKFKEDHPNFKVTIEADNRIFNIGYKASMLYLKFRVVRAKEANTKRKFDVENSGAMALSPAITRCLASRPNPGSLRNLLDMIAAYTDVRKTRCAKCTKQVDSSGLTPAARRRKAVDKSEAQSETVWESFHEGCL